uniref:Putative ovule protein n=1 Tax=Solanum chacoense TaxID=4108 RepID=A0A0V0GXY3_SOLCH
MIFLFFLKTSCVKHAFLMTSQVKHLTFVGAAVLQIFFHELWYLLLCELHSFLYALPTVKIPSLLCDHLTTSLPVLVPAKSPTSSNNLATLSISQSFRSLLK